MFSAEQNLRKKTFRNSERMVAYHFLLQELTAVDFETVSSYWVVKSVDFFTKLFIKMKEIRLRHVVD